MHTEVYYVSSPSETGQTPDLQWYFYHIHVPTSWMAFWQRAACSEPLWAADKARTSELRTASGSQG